VSLLFRPMPVTGFGIYVWSKKGQQVRITINMFHLTAADIQDCMLFAKFI